MLIPIPAASDSGAANTIVSCIAIAAIIAVVQFTRPAWFDSAHTAGPIDSSATNSDVSGAAIAASYPVVQSAGDAWAYPADIAGTADSSVTYPDVPITPITSAVGPANMPIGLIWPDHYEVLDYAP